MQKVLETSNNNGLEDEISVDKDTKEKEELIQVINLKSNQSFNESNLMTLPFVSLNKTKVLTLNRYWEVNGIKRGLTVKGSSNGCPTIAELDVLLALFRILIKNIDYKYEYNKTTKKASLPKTINFTYQELSNELGYKYYGGTIKKKLEKSIKTLIETTIYSDFSLYDISNKDYIDEFKGEQSFRILTNYRAYSYKRKKIKGEKIDNAKVIKENQSVDIDDFFFNSICSNYFKIYDYNKYISLTKGFSKKIYLMLNQWSKGFEKTLYYDTIYDYLSLEVEKDNVKQCYYYNKLIKQALDELKIVGFIDDYEINKSKSVNIIFSKKKKEIAYGKNKYNTPEEIIDRLQEMGITLKEWTKYYRMDNEDYVRGLLRMIDYKISKGHSIPNLRGYLLKGLMTEGYNVDEFY